ncbi:MAG TPA: tetratricopeptide repeat protein [Candidatus Omnitrophota bacterium]|nr:tetratricopeptide repeat protein [Candidatus Omnitrophota bacterium]
MTKNEIKKKSIWKTRLLKWGLILFVVGLAINTIFVAAHVGGLLREAARLVTLLGLLAIIVRICLTWWGIVLVVLLVGLLAWSVKDNYRILFSKRQQPVPLTQSVQNLVKEGMILFKDGKYDEASLKLNEALTAEPDQADLYFYAGIVESKLGNKEKALTYYGQAIQKNPRHFLAYKYSSMIFAEQRNNDKAHKYLINALLCNPNDGDTMYRLGLIEVMRNKFEAADRWFRKAKKAGYSVPKEHLRVVKKGLAGKAKVVKELPANVLETTQFAEDMLSRIPPEALAPYLKDHGPVEKMTVVPKLTTAERKWSAMGEGLTGGQVMGLLGNPDLVRKSYANNATQIQFFYGNGIVTLIDDKVVSWQAEA